MKTWYQMKKNEIMQGLSTREEGLKESEVNRQRENYGKNELPDTEKKNVFLLFLEQFKDFLVIILIMAAVISGILGDLESTIVILVVITMNAILGTIQNIKAEQSLDSLKQLSSPNAKVIRDGVTKVISNKEVVVGDVVILEAGDYVSADGRILDNASMKINESALTGESVTVEKEDKEISETVAIGDRINMVFSGSFVTYGRGKYVVTDVGSQTEIGKIATLLKNTKEKKTPLQVNLDQFGKKLSIIILLICGILFITSLIRGDEIINAFMFAVALAVAAIPEALSSIVTIVLSFGTQKLAKEHAIIRKLQAVEGLGSVSIICSDKTGTLTQNKMTVKNVFVDNYVIESSPDKNEVFRKLIIGSILCNDATNLNKKEIGDPTEIALINYGDTLGFYLSDIRAEHPRLDEIPFDSDRKLMSTVHVMNGKRIMITKGAVDVLSDRLSFWETHRGMEDFTSKQKAMLERTNEDFSKNGLRVLAFAYKELSSDKKIDLEDENGLTFLGLISMIDPPREESAEAVKQCIRAGIKPIMITGDHKVTATAIAKQIGILKEDSEAVEGMDVDALSDEELESFVEHVSVYARVSPENKIRIVEAWQKKGNIVAMTGDGVNDAPALKQADIGVAMGITGSEVAKDAASMVLTDDNFATIIKAVENGRNVYANIKKAIQFLLSGNTAGILAVLFASLFGLPVPFAPVHLLFINLLTDSLPAIALGLEPHSDSVMDEKPRPMNESILTKDFLMQILTEGMVIFATTMGSYFIGLHFLGDAGATTMAFATLCLSRLVHGFNCKAKEPVLFTRKFWSNKYLIGAFLIGFTLLNIVLLLPILQPIFVVTKLSWNLLLYIYGMSLLNLFIIQAIKKCKKVFN